MNEKTKKLLESSVVEDVLIGLRLLLAEYKPRTNKELCSILSKIDFKIENVDIYVSKFNVTKLRGVHIQVFGRTKRASNPNLNIIRI